MPQVCHSKRVQPAVPPTEPIWPANFGQSVFSHSIFVVLCCVVVGVGVCFAVCVCVVSSDCLSFVVVVRGVLVVVVRVGGVVIGLDHCAPDPSPLDPLPPPLPADRPSAGPPKISRFFSVSRLKIRSFSLLLCLLVEFWWCL